MNKNSDIEGAHRGEGLYQPALKKTPNSPPITLYTWRHMMNPHRNRKEPQASLEELLRELETLKKENKKLKYVVVELSLNRHAKKI